jgi:protocatechuate 3,4-dioxygenase beta subunit
MNVRSLTRTFALCSALIGSTTAALAQLTRTPETTEGPYYIFNSTQRLDTAWLVNADNDLTQVATSTTRASGTPLLLSGQLVNLSGAPVAGATIEIWQTDNNGLYYHSGNNYQSRDQSFQFFGTSVTDASGNYSFRTVRPGLYTGRIRHIHFKIKLNGTTLVTSQLMFEEDRSQFTTDMVAAQLGTSINLVLINPVAGTDSSGASVLVASRQFVVNATGTSTAGAPVITTQPSAASVSIGDTVSFSAAATSSTAVTYQWRKDGTSISGATAATLTLNAVTAANAGAYTVVITNSSGSTTSNAANLTVLTPSSTSTSALVNLSVRSYLPSSTASLTAGFVIQSASGKRMLVRAIGPALTSFGVAGALSDPRVEVYDASSNKMAENDTWDASLSTMFSQLGAFALPSGSKDAALTVTLPAGAGTAHVRGTDAGIALVEAYDTTSTATSRLVNLSARSTVGAADSMLIAGFVIQGTGTKRLLVRAVGPKLGEFGVTGALADPKLEIFNATGTVVSTNDDWSSSLASAFTQAAAFALNTGSKDAALVVTLPAGASYTAVVSGVNGATGEALVEIYDLQ